MKKMNTTTKMTAQEAFGIAIMPETHFAELLKTAKDAEQTAYAKYGSTPGTRGTEAIHASGHGSWVSGFTGQAEWMEAAKIRERLEHARGLRFDGPAVGWQLNRVHDDGAVEYLFCGDFLPPIATHGLVSREEIPANPADLVAMVRSRAAGRQ